MDSLDQPPPMRLFKAKAKGKADDDAPEAGNNSQVSDSEAKGHGVGSSDVLKADRREGGEGVGAGKGAAAAGDCEAGGAGNGVGSAEGDGEGEGSQAKRRWKTKHWVLRWMGVRKGDEPKAFHKLGEWGTDDVRFD